MEKKRKRRKDSKYMPRYAKWLRDGLRIDGMSVHEVALHFGITTKTYYHWRETIPLFDEAAAIGDRDSAIWWHKLNRSVASGEVKGNAGIINFAMKNIDGINWTDKKEIHTSSDEEVRVIKIEMLPSQPPMKFIEAEIVERTSSITHEESD